MVVDMGDFNGKKLDIMDKEILEEIIKYPLTSEEEIKNPHLKDTLAKSHYLLANIIQRGAGDDYDAFILLKKAESLSPNFQEAKSLKESLEIENNFFPGREESNVSNKK